MRWTSIIEDDYRTYPEEGINVLVSNGYHDYDVAWFLMSGEYRWQKDILNRDDVIDFEEFRITKWTYITSDEFAEKWIYNETITTVKRNL